MARLTWQLVDTADSWVAAVVFSSYVKGGRVTGVRRLAFRRAAAGTSSSLQPSTCTFGSSRTICWWVGVTAAAAAAGAAACPSGAEQV